MEWILDTPENSYGFDQQLIASNGVIASCDVATILSARLPGCIRVQKMDPETDRSGVDWWAELSNGRKVGVDFKGRAKDCRAYGNDDLALETWSVIGSKVGWTRDASKVCEWILWVWSDTGRFCLMPFPPLCGVFQKNWVRWLQEFPDSTQTTPATKGRSGWKSECVFVPRKLVIESVTAWCNGNAMEEVTCGR